MPHSQIIKTFLTNNCRTYILPGPWAQTPAHADARLTRHATQRILERLLSRFQLDDLLASRLVVRLADTELALNVKLGCPGTPVLGLRDVLTGEMFDICTPDGLVCSEEPSAFAAQREAHTVSSKAEWVECEPTLLIAASLPDVIVLRSLGIPAALNDGFPQMGSGTIDDLRRLFGMRCNGECDAGSATPNGHADPNTQQPCAAPDAPDAPTSDAPVADAPVAEAVAPEVGASDSAVGSGTVESTAREAAAKVDDRLPPMFVAWDISTLSVEMPESYLNAFLNFQRLGKYKHLDLMGMYDWAPHPDVIEQLEYLAADGDVESLREALLKSICDDSSEMSGVRIHPLVTPPQVPVETPLVARSLREAIDLLRTAFDTLATGTSARQQQEKAVAAYRHFVNEHEIRPVSAAAAAAADLVERQFHAQLELVLRRKFELIEQINSVKLMRVRVTHGEYEMSPRVNQELKNLDHDILALLKEIHKCSLRPFHR